MKVVNSICPRLRCRLQATYLYILASLKSVKLKYLLVLRRAAQFSSKD